MARFKGGMALPPQRDLAQQLGVSRASLREAVSILGTLGQLSIEQGRGTFLVSTVEGCWRRQIDRHLAFCNSLFA